MQQIKVVPTLAWPFIILLATVTTAIPERFLRVFMRLKIIDSVVELVQSVGNSDNFVQILLLI